MWNLIVFAVLLIAPVLHAATDNSSGVTAEAGTRPNILLIVADDLGFSDLGAFGGEISTPNLDRLAAKGVRLSNFHTGTTCSVSRAMLMSGADSHIAGLGNMAETTADNQLGRPGYEGHLNGRVKTIAEVLKSVGYHTYMSGKWHLGMQADQSPHSRGFDRSFAMLYGGGSHFADMAGGDEHRHPLLYRSDGKLLDKLPADFYSTTYYTDTLIQQIDSQVDDGNPFFAYLAYTAPHWPLQAPKDVIQKYRGKYDEGYDAVRERRLVAQKELGFFPEMAVLPQRPASLPPWLSLAEDERRFHAQTMEIYAAMVDYMDASIGRLVDYLARKKQLENTVIVFMSDNGAERWNYASAPPPVGKFASTFDNSPKNRGLEGSFVFYGPQWAHVSNAPFSRFKGSMYEGGIRAPAIVYWPGATPEGGIVDALTFITDWYATFAEIAGADVVSAAGKSLVPLLSGEVGRVRGEDEFIGLELWGGRAVVGEKFKMVSSSTWHGGGDGKWQLYEIDSDPAERTNLVAEQPEVFATMQKAWEGYVAENNVILPDGKFLVRPPNKKPEE